MPGNPNTGRRFEYESVKEYYDAKMSKFTSVLTPILRVPGPLSIEGLIAHFKEVGAGLLFPACALEPGAANTTWEATITAAGECKGESLWKFRDYVFATSMLWLTQFLETAGPIVTLGANPPREKPERFDIRKNEFTVIGSQKLTSDIDVTVQGPGAYFIIMIVEDLFHTLTVAGTPIRCMDVEYYTDFRIAKMAYVNVSHFDEAEKRSILKYAYISYFRSTHTLTLSPLARRLGELYVEKLGGSTTLESVLEEAIREWTTSAPGGILDREKFYAIAKHIDDETRDVYHLIIAKQWQGAAAAITKFMTRGPKEAKRRSSFAEAVNATTADRDHHKLANTIFFDIARGNIHRPESYLIPSTAIHVVDIEQLKDAREVNVSVSSYFGKTPATGVEAFTYIASAIEQLGYLEHYHPPGTLCSIKGIKYVGRMIRALEKANVVKEDTYTSTYVKLNRLRQTGVVACEENIPALEADLVTTVRPAAGGHRMTIRKKVTPRPHASLRRTKHNGNRR